MTYESAVEYVSSLRSRGWRLGLERMERLVRELGSPHVGRRFFHVAGTNGKGSVTSYIQSILTEMGVNVGGYFSPYVYDFRERIQHRRRLIDREAFARLTEKAIPFAEGLAGTEVGGVTEFEFKTAVGFLYWEEKGCEAVALEVGLGGRLDATNVVTPATCVITRIALDHEEYLGDSVAEIAREKAGIIKAGVPVVSATGDSEAAEVVRRVGWELGCQVYEIGKDFGAVELADGWGLRVGELETPCVLAREAGRIAATNASIALAALRAGGYEPSSREIREGLAKGKQPGRLERVDTEPCFVLDGAHNADAVRAVVKEVSESSLLGAIVWSSATGHDAGKVLDVLVSEGMPVVVVPMSHVRGLGRAELVEMARAFGMLWADNVEIGVRKAMELVSEGECVLVTGSFYLLSEAKMAIYRALGLDMGAVFEPA